MILEGLQNFGGVGVNTPTPPRYATASECTYVFRVVLRRNCYLSKQNRIFDIYNKY